MSGFTAGIAIKVVPGLTQRKIDHWVQLGLITPARPASGKGSERRFSFPDLVRLAVISRLRLAGVSLQRIRAGLEVLRRKSTSRDPLLCEVLLTDGKTIFRRVDGRTLEDILGDGQLVFSLIAVGKVEEETRVKITKLSPGPTRGRPLLRAHDARRRRAASRRG